MGKYIPQNKAPILNYPSQYGSHTSMVNGEKTAKLTKKEQGEFVMCEDDYGTYKTEKWRLDCGLADPHRNSGNRFAVLSKKKTMK